MGDQYLSKEKTDEPVFTVEEQKDEWVEERKKRFETQQKMFEQSQAFETDRTDESKELHNKNMAIWDEKLETVKQQSPQKMHKKPEGLDPGAGEVDEDERLKKLEEDEKLKTENDELKKRLISENPEESGIENTASAVL